MLRKRTRRYHAPPHPTPVQPVDTTPETFYARKNGDIKFDTPSQGAVSTACLKQEYRKHEQNHQTSIENRFFRHFGWQF